MRIFPKLIILSLSISLIPAIFISYVIFVNVRSSMEREFIDKLKSVTSLKAERIETFFSVNKETIRSARNLLILKQNLPILAEKIKSKNAATVNEARKILDSYLIPFRSSYGYADVILRDPSGSILYSANKQNSSFSLSLPFVVAAKNDPQEITRGNVTKSSYQGFPYIIPVASGIRGYNGETIGYIEAYVDMEEVYKILRDNTGTGNTGESLIVQKTGKNKVIFLSPLRFDPKAILKKEVVLGQDEALPAQKAAKGESGIGLSIDYRGREVISCWRYLPSLGYGLVSKVDTEEAFASIGKIQKLIFFVFILTFIMVFIVAFSLAKSISDPIHELHKGTEIIGAGNLNHKVGKKSRDEIGQLSRAFDEMVGNLKMTTASKAELEEEVKQRKNAEENLKVAISDLERSNKELEQFAYVASHDLQEPLRMVTSYTQLLEKKYNDMLDDKGREFIHYATDGAKRMQNLITDLLQFSRVSTKGKPFVSCDASKCCENAIANLSVAIKESGAKIEANKLPKIIADEAQISSLFQNLISNSLKYRGEATPQIKISCAERPGEWLFFVRDNGIGIEREYHERIFVLFQRLHTREEYSGTGIGLAVCKKIVERHGGNIWVESEIGKGAIFYFTIPKKQKRKIGEILVEDGLITSEALDKTLKKQEGRS
ncbi:MAG: HAMP domain-containing protein [Candidatus Omnitrophica bacterium]|nr:HAMP domain-containing protein [Candidatus Omnitrophota bacterium]